MRPALLCGLCLGLVLAGCGGDSFPVKVDPEIRADGTTVLRRGNGAEPESLDPHQARSVSAANILRALYERLVSRAPDGSLEPGGAASWTISDDRLTYTFQLREDARWSNGAPVTASDYVCSLRRAVTPATGSVYAQMRSPILNASEIIAGEKPPETLGVRALDEHRLEIRLQSVTPYFLGIVTHNISYPVYRPAVEKYRDQHTL